MCRTGKTKTYTELLNLAIRVETNQEAIKKSSASGGGFSHGCGAFKGRGINRAVPYDPPHQGVGGNDCRDYRSGR